MHTCVWVFSIDSLHNRKMQLGREWTIVWVFSINSLHNRKKQLGREWTTVDFQYQQFAWQKIARRSWCSIRDLCVGFGMFPFNLTPTFSLRFAVINMCDDYPYPKQQKADNLKERWLQQETRIQTKKTLQYALFVLPIQCLATLTYSICSTGPSRHQWFGPKAQESHLGRHKLSRSLLHDFGKHPLVLFHSSDSISTRVRNCRALTDIKSGGYIAGKFVALRIGWLHWRCLLSLCIIYSSKVQLSTRVLSVFHAQPSCPKLWH